jgi:acyl-CoA reductase-like NAD-dependent aldehyde dehydrogenase
VLGYGMNPDTFLGPLISDNLRTRVRAYGRALSQRGHTALLPAEEPHGVDGRRGNYITPSIWSVDWRNGSPFLNDEPPGPTLLLYRCDSLDELVMLHEQAQFRVVTSVFARSDDPAVAVLRERLRTGTLNLNRATIGTSMRLPSLGVGRAANGFPSGPELLRALTAPRTSLGEQGRFDPDNLVPGVRWADDEDTDLGGALEPAAE